ncbi:hypothetical protein F4V57_03135 [Acinetobacter qingfengensis]|uniref:Uncharacterized protein n=1 Tax=Acinetobacter qingfengensis TaxID=1262585 RepID=A0A1E7RE43_9GAMM|nr:hypothetical protein [Acinetobacter qingfengensis]KAA8734771.1 hypothetical protein F4V57_03135 [Acinetobacter qingfengensis]OEY97689.1 hypothetical protein BJI46_08745 [Acinetobacter qingfengensis]
MKKTVLSIICILCSSAIWAENNAPVQAEGRQQNNADNQGSISIINRPEIVGLWGMDIPNNKQCVEYYNFRGNNEVVVKSAQEWSIGQYQYQAPNNRAEVLPMLIMQIKYDNNEKDCSGIQEDQTGQIQQFFVKWINPQKIEFCGTEKGQQCFAILNKQLP